ncbi:hypothetical protein [Chryseobacterium sp.]|uniref:hypothetical protein n=1 Tax=Chryseobacterium sp. TaxID=1871047 RepID=UPI0025C0FF47|nr:hypothetical protein [Chryseobacterium sp.]MBV8325023.1 hypothetical protein [Chryseobacterium sp.]
MKKKLFIAAFGILSLASVMSFEASSEAGSSDSTGRKFWGWSDWNCSGNEYLTCCTRTHYVLWMENSYDVQCN